MAAPTPSIDLLLEHASFVRSVAGAVLRRSDLTDDAVQDTWIAALERPPKRPEQLRGWLRVVARRRAEDIRRRDARRRHRERAAAQPERLPSTHSLAERIEQGHALARAVLDLDTAYRSVLLLRYYEGLRPPEVAERMGIPLETVRTRIKRGLKKLRTRFDAAPDGERSRNALWALLEPLPVLISPTTLGALVVKKAIVAVLAVGGLALWWFTSSPESSGPGPTRGAEPTPTHLGTTEKATPGLSGSETVPPTVEQGTPSTPTRNGTVLTGLVTVVPGQTPLADVRVRLLVGDPSAPRAPPQQYEAVTDADGRYRIEGVAPGKGAILPSRPGFYVPALAGVAKGPFNNPNSPPPSLTVIVPDRQHEMRRNLVLRAGVTVRGFVRSPTGATVPGATIHTHGYSLEQLAALWGLGEAWKPEFGRVRSDADGRFTIRGLAPRADYIFYARRRPFQSVPSDAIDLTTRNEGSVEVILSLSDGATLAGRVLDADGRGVLGARIGAFGGNPRYWTHKQPVLSSEDGTFLIAGLPAETPLSLIVRADGHAPLTVGPEPLELGERRDLDIRLPKGGQVTGVLVDASGEPVAAQEMTLQSLAGFSSFHVTKTNADGAFIFRGVATGQAQLRVAGDERVGPRRLGAPILAPAKGLRVVVPSLVRSIVAGRIQLPDGSPVPLSLVHVRSLAEEMRLLQVNPGTHANEVVNGALRREVIGPPPFLVTVTHARDDRGRPLPVQSRTLEIADGFEDVTIRLVEGGMVQGFVRAADGTGVAGARVEAAGVSVISSTNGSFEIAGLAEGLVRIQATPPDGWLRPDPVPVEVGAEDVEIRLRRAGAISGRVATATGEEVVGCMVQASWNSPTDGKPGGIMVHTERAGRFLIAPVPEDADVSITVYPRRRDYPVTRLTGVRVGPNETEILLKRGASIRGVFVDSEGKGVTGAYVVARPLDDSFAESAAIPLEPDGSFQITVQSPGVHELQVIGKFAGVRPGITRVLAPATDVRIVQPATARIAGRIVGGATLREGLSVRAWEPTQPTRTAAEGVSDGAGRFVLEGLEAGKEYVVGAAHAGRGCFGRSAPVQAGSESLQLILQSGLTLRGMLLDEDGKPAKQPVWIDVSGDDWHVRRLVPAGGRIEISGLPAGRYSLNARGATSETNHLRARQVGVRADSTDVELQLRGS